jgi:hypothetical protein
MLEWVFYFFMRVNGIVAVAAPASVCTFALEQTYNQEQKDTRSRARYSSYKPK